MPGLVRRRVLALMTRLLLLVLRLRRRLLLLLLRRGARGRHGAIYRRRRGRDGRGALVPRVAGRRQAVVRIRVRAVLHVVGRRRWIQHGIGWMSLVVKVSRGRGGRMRRLRWCGGKGWVVLWRII